MILIDNKYTSIGGLKVEIYCIDTEGLYPIHGAIYNNGTWIEETWTLDGLSSLNYEKYNIWFPKDKEPVWCWDNEDTTRKILSFWDEKYNGVYTHDGLRDGTKFDNYAKVDHLEQWMTKAHELLEN
jgi:hypothetical protein